MLRSDVAALIALDLSSVLAAANMVGTDSVGNLKEPIDRALRAMGVASADLLTAEPADDSLYEAQAMYETLRTVYRRLGDQINIGTGGDNFQLNQMFANVKALLDEAAARVAALGGSKGGSGLLVGTMDLGFNSTLPDEYAADEEWILNA